MNTLPSLQPPGVQKKPQNNLGSLASAMAETEKRSYGKTAQGSSSNSLLSEAMARTGGHLPQDFGNNDFNLKDFQDHQQKQLEEQEKKRLHKELHDRVNPVELHDVFKAGSERTKKELEEVRKELKALINEIKLFYKEVDIAVSQQVTDQGQDGKGLKNYFLKLRMFIMLLRQKVHSARTWQQQAQNKKARQQSRKGPGAMLAGQRGHSETKAIFDTMHHERSNAYSGG